MPANGGDTGSLGLEDPLEKEMATTSVYFPGKSHGQTVWRDTVNGFAESDMTWQLNT